MNKTLPIIISDTPLDTLEKIVSDTITHPDGIKMLAKLLLDATYCDIEDAMHQSGIVNLNAKIKAVPIPPEIYQAWNETELLAPIPFDRQTP